MSLAVDLMVVGVLGSIVGLLISYLIISRGEKVEEVKEMVCERSILCDFDGPIPEDTPRCDVCGVSAYEPPYYELRGTESSWSCKEHLEYVLAREKCDRCTGYYYCWHSAEDDDPDDPSSYWPDPRGCKGFEDMGNTE